MQYATACDTSRIIHRFGANLSHGIQLSHDELLQVLEALHRSLHCLGIFAKGETRSAFADGDMFLTVELTASVSPALRGAHMNGRLTSLTGIDETPTSIAMNQHALKNQAR